MKKIVHVKGVKIGEGLPKICVPMVGETLEELIEEANPLNIIDVDIVEWRADFFENIQDIDKVKLALQEIRQILINKPIIFTLRSLKEGGNKEIDADFYFELNKIVVHTKLVDIIDIELFNEEKEIKGFVDLAHENNVSVIISSHDFDKTPTKDEMILRMGKAIELGGDIPKIAVMPNSVEDVIRLLDATRIMKEKYADRPIITISMGGKGIVSRFAGELFGSDLTFAAVCKASAPGQISVVELRKIIQLLHNNL